MERMERLRQIRQRWRSSQVLLRPLVEWLETMEDQEPEDQARLDLLDAAPNDIAWLLDQLAKS